MHKKGNEIKSGNIIDTIGSIYESLTPSAKRIASAVVKAPQSVSKQTISELSQTASVGDATIIRFCRSLGFKGFQDFKMELAIELSNNKQQDKSIFDSDVTSEDSSETVAYKLKQSLVNVLTETINLLNFDVVDDVAHAIKNSKSLYFFGIGSSGLAAEGAKHKFMRIGLSVDAFSNNHFMYMKASLQKIWCNYYCYHS